MWIIHSENISLFELSYHALEGKRIGSNHFTEDQVKSIDAKGMRKLKIGAVPIDQATLTVLMVCIMLMNRLVILKLICLF